MCLEQHEGEYIELLTDWFIHHFAETLSFQMAVFKLDEIYNMSPQLLRPLVPEYNGLLV